MLLSSINFIISSSFIEFKNNIKKAWMKKFVQESKYNVGLDSAILMNPLEIPPKNNF